MLLTVSTQQVYCKFMHSSVTSFDVYVNRQVSDLISPPAGFWLSLQTNVLTITDKKLKLDFL
jgi:hypothetical protein